MSLRSAIVSQFQHPRGLLGRAVGVVLAGRGSNLLRNRWTVDLLDPTGGERVLEIGCGPGVALQLCLSRAGVRAVGVDHSKLMISQTGRRNRRAADERRLSLVQGTVDDLPAELGPFDQAFSINVIQFVDREAFVARVRSLLKPGGVFATTYQPRHANATRADALKMAVQLEAILKARDFGGVRTEELDLKPVPAVCVIGRLSPRA